MKKLFLLLGLIALLPLATKAQNIVPTRVIGNGTYTNMLVASYKPTKLFAVTGYNSGSLQDIQIFQSSAPTNGMIPIFSIPVAATQYFSIDFSYYGADLDKITICNSSTGDTLTKGGSDCGIQAIIRAN